ncbi:MAG: hypothetical protein SGI88_09190 [Candidatus Hydrogenedentes bacterium]|nr:hypothetical protein [Candidatus Hydrogenedentota bacterium]
MAASLTTLGTPRAPGWSREWFARVEAEEQQLNRRICGGVTPAMTPCTLSSDHSSGRCRFHGGTPNIGPPADNLNARVHGLYSRRLQRCGVQCPLWESCGFASDDILALPVKQRPYCAYEREEYAALVAFYFKDELEPEIAWEDDGDAENDHDDWGSSLSRSECPEPFLMHQLVLLTVMCTRAAAVLGNATLTDAVEVESERYRMKTVKPGAALEAFLRIAREFRGLRAVISTKKLIPEPRKMGLASRYRDLMIKTRGVEEEAIAETERRRKEEAGIGFRVSGVADENGATRDSE